MSAGTEGRGIVRKQISARERRFGDAVRTGVSPPVALSVSVARTPIKDGQVSGCVRAREIL